MAGSIDVGHNDTFAPVGHNDTFAPVGHNERTQSAAADQRLVEVLAVGRQS